MFFLLLTLGVVLALPSCKSKPPTAEPPSSRRGADSRALDAGDARTRGTEASTAEAMPVPRAPERLVEALDAGAATGAAAGSSAEAITRVRALESFKRLAEVPTAVARLAHAKEWDKALDVIRSVDSLGKRVKDESQEFVTRAGPEALDFVTKLATFVIDARTELSMVEVDRSPEQREKSVKRFVEIGKAVFR
jgi:hypothetical protein